MGNLEVAALPDCSTTACPAKCTCAEKACTTQLEACLADPICAAEQECADKCPCGSTMCLFGCVAKHASAKGAAALKCVEANCATDDAVVPLFTEASPLPIERKIWLLQTSP